MARHGLLTQQSGAAPPPGPATGAPSPGATAEEQPNVSPEEQEQYNQFVNNAFSAIYDDKALPQILESLKGDGDPVEGLANTAAMTVARVKDSARNAGQKVSPDVAFHAGSDILTDLAELSEKAGIHSFSDEEIDKARLRALDIFREMRGRDGGPAKEALARDFNEIVALDKAGRLDEIAPGLGQEVGRQAAL